MAKKKAHRNKKTLKTKKPPVLFSKTQKIIKEIQNKTGGRFISYWTSMAGAVCQDDVNAFYEILQKIGKQKELYLFIKSQGGSGRASLRIVNLLRKYGTRLYACLPLECASAATMLALGADEIRMGPLAYLTAIDTSITHELSPVDRDNELVSVSQDELDRVITLWREEAKGLRGRQTRENQGNPYASLFGHVHPLVIGAVDRASSLSTKLCTEILMFHMKDRKRATRISHHLNGSYPTHDYPIIRKEARGIGLNAHELDAEVNDLMLELNEIYSEMGQRAVTDYDELNYHNNEITNIIESVDIQLHYQIDKDWHRRVEERVWVSLNDDSSWRKIEKVRGKLIRSEMHIR